MSKKIFLFAAVCLAISPAVLSAQIVVDFTASPFDTQFEDLAIDGEVLLSKSGTSRYGKDFDSVFKLIDAKAIESPLGGGVGSNSLVTADKVNIGVTGLGVGGSSNSGSQGIENSDFNFSQGLGESIEFSLSVETVSASKVGRIVFDEFRFGSFDQGESFSLQSEEFKGKNFAGFGDGVSFDDLTGTFTFTNDTGTRDTFSLTPITETNVSNSIWASENATYTLAFTGSNPDPGVATFRGFTFHAVPEPAFMGFLAASGVGFVVYRRRKRKVNAESAE